MIKVKDNLEETHVRAYRKDKEFLKKHRQELPMAAFLHYIIQFYKAKK